MGLLYAKGPAVPFYSPGQQTSLKHWWEPSLRMRHKSEVLKWETDSKLHADSQSLNSDVTQNGNSYIVLVLFLTRSFNYKPRQSIFKDVYIKREKKTKASCISHTHFCYQHNAYICNIWYKHTRLVVKQLPDSVSEQIHSCCCCCSRLEIKSTGFFSCGVAQSSADLPCGQNLVCLDFQSLSCPCVVTQTRASVCLRCAPVPRPSFCLLILSHVFICKAYW